MMNDRFSAQLRQHLVESANERPADGQMAAIAAHVAVTPQRRPLVPRLPGFQGRISGFSGAVRYGLIAVALVLAAVAGAILAGGGPSRPTTPFEGTWTAIDPLDGSTMWLVVGPGRAPTLRIEDLWATRGACVDDEVKHFKADGLGEVVGERMNVTFPKGGGCGLMLTPIEITHYDYDARTDRLFESPPYNVVWSRAPGAVRPAPATLAPETLAPETLAPEAPSPNPMPGSSPDPTPGATSEGTLAPSGCIDLANGGTYAGPVGPGHAPGARLSLTATVPESPEVPWQGFRGDFHLTSRCGFIGTMSISASTATESYPTSCMPDLPENASFADAIARLDAPTGEDIADRIDLTIGGYRAARYDVSGLVTCPQGFGLWAGTLLGGGETGSIYVIDADGVLLAIELNRSGDQTQAELEEARGIIESLQIGF